MIDLKEIRKRAEEVIRCEGHPELEELTATYQALDQVLQPQTVLKILDALKESERLSQARMNIYDDLYKQCILMEAKIKAAEELAEQCEDLIQLSGFNDYIQAMLEDHVNAYRAAGKGDA